MRNIHRTLIALAAALSGFPTWVMSAGTPAASLPMRIVVGEVEPAAQQAAITPAQRRVYPDPAGLDAAIEAQERHTDALLRDARARGTAVGWDENDTPVIKVYVDETTALPAIPDRLDGIPVEVEYTGRLYALNIACEERADRCQALPEPGMPTAVASAAGEPGPTEYQPRPVPIGVSAGHFNVTAGTIACRVTAGCHTYALSNAHVFADENAGVVGDNILQPGVYDGGINPADTIGTLADSVPINISEFAFNRVDAAIALSSPTMVSNATPSSGYGVPKSNPLNASVGLQVKKFGRTTAMTYGYVDAVNATVLVAYSAGDARFVGQIIIKPNTGADFSRPGDSGSLVVADGGGIDRRPVGLLFASGTGISVANPITDVLNQLNISIDGQ